MSDANADEGHRLSDDERRVLRWQCGDPKANPFPRFSGVNADVRYGLVAQRLRDLGCLRPSPNGWVTTSLAWDALRTGIVPRVPPTPSVYSLSEETLRTLDEVIRHSLSRTGEVARAIGAGLITLQGGPALSTRHRQSLEEWISMVSECGGVGDRWRSWRDVVMTLVQALDARRARTLENA
jgi:hypothetical protein